MANYWSTINDNHDDDGSKMKQIQQRCDITLLEVVEIISRERIKRNIDKRQESFRRITKAIANLISTDNEVKERLINAYLENDRSKKWL